MHVPPSVIRDLFNASGYLDRIVEGTIVEDIKRHQHRDPPPDGCPYCTHSQIIRYFTEDGQKVAVVHQYKKPDGSIAASGKPDPKWLHVDGITYVATLFEPEAPTELG